MRERKMLIDFNFFLCRFFSYCNRQLFRTKVFSKKKNSVFSTHPSEYIFKIRMTEYDGVSGRPSLRSGTKIFLPNYLPLGQASAIGLKDSNHVEANGISSSSLYTNAGVDFN